MWVSVGNADVSRQAVTVQSLPPMMVARGGSTPRHAAPRRATPRHAISRRTIPRTQPAEKGALCSAGSATCSNRINYERRLTLAGAPSCRDRQTPPLSAPPLPPSRNERKWGWGVGGNSTAATRQEPEAPMRLCSGKPPSRFQSRGEQILVGLQPYCKFGVK